jgi:hypothetical protein
MKYVYFLSYQYGTPLLGLAFGSNVYKLDFKIESEDTLHAALNVVRHVVSGGYKEDEMYATLLGVTLLKEESI